MMRGMGTGPEGEAGAQGSPTVKGMQRSIVEVVGGGEVGHSGEVVALEEAVATEADREAAVSMISGDAGRSGER